MSMHRLGGVAAILSLVFAAPVAANEFVSNRRADWYRYAGPGGQEVRAQISMESGGWRLWSEFGGLGSVWVYTATGYDWLWVYNPQTQTAEAVANLSGQVGSSRTANLGALNNGRVTVAARNGALTTPAGAFTDVTQLTFQTSAADAGVTAMWFARGVGLVKYQTQSIAGPRDFTLAAASVNGRAFPAAAPAPTPTPTAVTRAPSEHAAMESILWGCNDTYMIVPTYRDAFRGLHGSGVRSEVAVDSNAVASQVRYEMVQQGVPLDDVSFLVAALDSVWMRDYGPIILKAGNGARQVADLDYYPGRYDDDRFPAAYANHRGWPRVRVPLSYEGGNFACDGRGQGMSSRGVLWFNDDKTEAQVRAEFRKLGCDRVEFFEPLADEGTTHIDMFARVMSDTEALVSRYPSGHRQYPIVEEAARKMVALGYRVTRVDSATSWDEYATYANSVLANGIALVPQYGVASRDQAALQAYTSLGFRAVGIDSRQIIRYGGATHCLSMQIPR